MLTSEPFLKDRTAERTLTTRQTMAAKEVMRLKALQTSIRGSGCGLRGLLEGNDGALSKLSSMFCDRDSRFLHHRSLVSFFFARQLPRVELKVELDQ